MDYQKIINYSGYIPKCNQLKSKNFKTEDWFPGGDAPKDFIRAYFYKKGELRASKWNHYIAKVGHKHYPIESITEHLLNEIGRIFNMNTAESELSYIQYASETQIRFFSKYFLNSNSEQLIHGADIYATYLGDENIIKEIDAANKERDLITVQEAQLAIAYVFPKNPELFEEYIKLLLFDALVGNNDRHFYNWGCIKSLSGNDVHFSPIYDTARGLLWNISDEELLKWHLDIGLRNVKLSKYLNKSMPKVGWNGRENLNHFDLVALIFEHELGMSKETISNFFDVNKLTIAKEYILKGPFSTYFIKERLEIIIDCLSLRFKQIQQIIRD